LGRIPLFLLLALPVAIVGCGKAGAVKAVPVGISVGDVDAAIVDLRRSMGSVPLPTNCEELEMAAFRLLQSSQGKPTEADAKAIFDKVTAISNAIQSGAGKEKVLAALQDLESTVTAVKGKS
jgi:hypothetical protein